MILSPATLAAFRDGDDRTVNRLVAELSPVIYRHWRRLTRDDDAAWDVVQETWALAWSHRAEFRGAGSFTRWLLRLSHTASRRARSALEGQLESSNIDSLPALAPADPDEALLRQDFEDEVMTAVLELPKRQRSVVLHRVIAGMSTRETAQLLHCAEGTVKATLNQGLGALRRRMSETRGSGDFQ